MQKLRNKTAATTIALFLMLTIAVTLVALPTADAHTPAWSIKTFAYVSVAPNPVGVGQQVLVTAWLHIQPPTALGAYGDRWKFTVEVTKPDGSKETLGPLTSDPIGSSFTFYTPAKVGNYTFQASFPETKLAGANLHPTDPTGQAFINDTFLASTSEIATLTVQQEPIPTFQEAPLPTDYWSRPIYGEHRGWWSISGDWLLSTYATRYSLNYNPYTKAPESAHILWTKPIAIGGLVGGNFSAHSYHEGGAYEGKWSPPVIIDGKLYYNIYPDDIYYGDPQAYPRAPPKPGFVCVDLRTGEELWRSYAARIAHGQIYYYDSPNQHGAFAYLWATVGTTWMAFDAFTGDWVYNITNVPMGTMIYGSDGSMLIPVLNTAGDWLALWNSSAIPELLGGSAGTHAWQWRPQGKSVDGRKGYVWNATNIPADLVGGISWVLDDRVIGQTGLGATAWLPLGTTNATMWALSLKSGEQGRLLWKRNFATTTGETLELGSASLPDRVFTLKSFQTRRHWGYSIDTGEQLWGPTPSQDVWDMFLHMTTGIAYGKLISVGYAGVVYAYDAKNGTLLWTYEADDPTWEAKHGGNYALYFAGAADGKIYVSAGEHSPDDPKERGSLMYCLEAESGEELWTVPYYRAPWASGVAIADGILVGLNTMDNLIYAYGKGQTATTVTASPKVSVHGDSVLIEGTVTDQSPGKPDTPAISDESMTQWMKYLYMQWPIPTNATGVTVTLDVIDANGNYRSIGTATTDTSGTFSYMWKPDIPGKYTLIATFQGSESYYASYTETAFGVTEAPAATPTPTPSPASMADLYFVPAAAGIIIAIAIATALIMLMLRKRP
jgi:outer membrane protein assembly factor BamB